MGMFSSAKKDASGQADTIQEVGVFKGIIEVENKQDKIEYEREKNELLDTLKKQINDLSLKVHKKPFALNL